MVQKTDQMMSSNHVMTPCLIYVISNNGIGEESPKKVANCDFWVGGNLAFPLIKPGFCFYSNKIGLK